MTLFTQEDLLLYLYKESSPELTVALETALKEDWMLREKLQMLQSSIIDSGLGSDKITFSPRIEVIQRVMNYARETSTESVQHS
ncbi:hypothetical protein ACX0G9_08955 [Flavitalea flava]